MVPELQTIPLFRLAIAFLPAVIVVFICYRWAVQAWTAVYAQIRMLIQLLAIGYLLTYIFDTKQPGIVLLVLCIMVLMASWIALRPLSESRKSLYPMALLSIVLGGGLTLGLVTQVVLRLEPWFEPRFMIPLAGMIISACMNTVSLAAERYRSERNQGEGIQEARTTAMRAALIPAINTLFAVGLVALPGMMTGQILSGIDPLIAVRYQIMVMCMTFGAAGISTAIYLVMVEKRRVPVNA